MNQNEGKAFINSEDVVWEQADEGVERKILSYDGQVMMVCVRFEKDAIGTLHHHIHRQVSYVASGSFEVTIDDTTSVLKQGDSFFVAPGLIHGVRALEQGMLVDVFTPARLDFIK